MSHTKENPNACEKDASCWSVTHLAIKDASTKVSKKGHKMSVIL